MIYGETIVEGKSVEDWKKEIEEIRESLFDKGIMVMAWRDHIPKNAEIALVMWEKGGKISERETIEKQAEGLRKQANTYFGYEAWERKKAEQFKLKNKEEKAEQHQRYAEARKAKANKLLEDAEALIANWKPSYWPSS